jgi:hypothetical protein
MQLLDVAQLRWVGIGINALDVGTRKSNSIHAAIGTAQSAKSTHARSGSENDARNCCPSDTSILFSASLIN